MKIFHTHALEKKSKNYVKQVWVPKKIVYVKVNTQGPHIKRVPEKEIQYFVGKNTKKRNTNNLEKNTSKVYNSRKR